MQSALALGLILLSVRRAHREARRAGQHLHQVYEQSVQGVVVLCNGQVVYGNPAALKIFGYDSIVGVGDIAARIASADQADVRARYGAG